MYVDRNINTGILEQEVMRRRIDEDGHEAVLECVIPEDIGDLGTDDSLNAVVKQRPRRMLA